MLREARDHECLATQWFKNILETFERRCVYGFWQRCMCRSVRVRGGAVYGRCACSGGGSACAACAQARCETAVLAVVPVSFSYLSASPENIGWGEGGVVG